MRLLALILLTACVPVAAQTVPPPPAPTDAPRQTRPAGGRWAVPPPPARRSPPPDPAPSSDDGAGRVGDAFGSGQPCAEVGVEGEVIEGGWLPTCFEAPPRPPSGAVFVPFSDGDRWDFAVERQAFHVLQEGVRFDTLGTESWRVDGTVEMEGRMVPVLHVVRADATGAVTDRARCAVVAEVEALTQTHWDRWEDAVRGDLAERSAQTHGDEPPPSGRGPRTSVLMGPQEIVTLAFGTLDGACPVLDAWVMADPMAGALSPLLIGADVFQAEALGVAQGAPSPQADRFESDLWLFAGGVGPYFRALHTESPDGRVEDRFHRLTHAHVGDVVLGRPLGVDVGTEAGRVEPADVGEVAFISAGPNPFRDRLTLRFTVPTPGPVSVEVYDTLGRRISRTDLGDRPAGTVEYVLPGTSLASGVYIIRAEAGEEAAIHRVTRIR